MQRLGRVLHVSPSRNVIVKIENIPKIGETVVDENLRPVGKISDIFGPVSSPYASVKPTLREPEKLTNKMLYVLPSKRRKEKLK
ncbi:MAG: H/ACA ribonucleoprotein complex subunit GAR1 [Candidatus Bathyarchaeales archaeon]